MSVDADDLAFFGCANHAEADTGTQGGAIDLSVRVALDNGQISTPDTVNLVADAIITGTWVVEGRLSGAEVSEEYEFSAETEKDGTQSFDRILKVYKKTTSPAGALGAAVTLGVYEETSGDAICYLRGSGVAPGATEEVEVRTLFRGATIPGSGSTVRYEKVFVKNLHATEAVSSGEVKETADPGSLFDFAVATAVNDTETTADRMTAPSAVGSFSSLDKDLPASLAAGQAIGVWFKYTLTNGDAQGVKTHNGQLAGVSHA